MADTVHTITDTKSTFSLVDFSLEYDSATDNFVLSRAGVSFPLALGTSIGVNHLVTLLAAAKTALGVS